jgi:hypothetical protein
MPGYPVACGGEEWHPFKKNDANRMLTIDFIINCFKKVAGFREAVIPHPMGWG